MREIENLEAGLGVALTATAYGLVGAASGIGDAIGSAIRQAAYLRRVDTLTREAVRQQLSAKRLRAASQAAADAAAREATIARINARLRLASA